MTSDQVDSNVLVEIEIDPSLRHFIRLARCGRFLGASQGEAGAWALTMAIAEHVPDLDSAAVGGLVQFVWLCMAWPETARDCLVEDLG